ncbi:MAG: sulfatase-like hydrolase/transferase [Alphaproteobacteria bacterium]
MQQPNIVVVLVDQLRRQALGFAGDPNLCTPNIDRLAREGVSFSAACSTFPACVPFRFSLMTGQYAHSRNVPALGYRISPAERTLAESIGDLGYHTAYVGKWHLYSAYGVSGGLSLSQACRIPIPASHRRGWDDWRGFELRNDYYDTWYFRDDEDEPRQLKGYQTDALFDLAFDIIETERPTDRPLFLTLSVEAPHPPFVAPPGAVQRVAARGPLSHRRNVDVRDIRFFPPEWYQDNGPGGAIDPQDPSSVSRVFEANMQGYYAMIEVIDANMGRLNHVLQRAGLADNTILVFLSDHGELGGSHGLLGKAEPWEESIAIPFIVNSSTAGLVPGGRVCDVPLHTEDLFATFIGLAGGDTAPMAPRENFAPFLLGQASEPTRDGVLLEFVTETRANRAYFDETWRGIRTKGHKYTVRGTRAGARPWQLFDLAADPFEQRNLVEDPNMADIATDLHRRLKALLDASADDYALAPAFGVEGRCAVPT